VPLFTVGLLEAKLINELVNFLKHSEKVEYYIGVEIKYLASRLSMTEHYKGRTPADLHVEEQLYSSKVVTKLD